MYLHIYDRFIELMVLSVSAKSVRSQWNVKERKAIETLIAESVHGGKPPTDASVQQIQRQSAELSTRKWQTVKYRVWAEAEKIKKKLIKQPALLNV